MRNFDLLSTDFDGTLVGHPSSGQCTNELKEYLKWFTDSGGHWVVNTGRSLEHMLEGLDLFDSPTPPHSLIVNERHLYQRGNDGVYYEVEEWNRPCDKTHEDLWKNTAPLLASLRRFAETHEDMEFVEKDGKPEGIISPSLGLMEEFLRILEEGRREFPDFSYQRNAVYLRFCHREYSKGSALAFLAGKLGISPASTLAAGDNHNDLSMLCPAVARFQVCPDNSVEEVKSRVAAAPRGFVSKLPNAQGTLEGLLNFSGLP
jgi:HAD superfamily hydrolase (TIGR01484 family)